MADSNRLYSRAGAPFGGQGNLQVNAAFAATDEHRFAAQPVVGQRQRIKCFGQGPATDAGPDQGALTNPRIAQQRQLYGDISLGIKIIGARA